MDFIGKNFSGVLGTLALIAIVLIGGYLLIYLLPLLIVAGVIIYAVVMGKRYFKAHLKKNGTKINKTMKNSETKTAGFTSENDLDGEVIDVDYREV